LETSSGKDGIDVSIQLDARTKTLQSAVNGKMLCYAKLGIDSGELRADTEGKPSRVGL
jgi:hypothetical protein